ncbi:glycosyltransferase [Rouxiella sp. T17]|uniref:glycosyltransferase n=1 Tax=Rouxiella sp. T17 TaxID=3085684 RepID=UPI002FCA346F
MSSEQASAPLTPLAGVVVWFNPTAIEVENIKSYLDFVQNLYVVDNSAGDNSSLLAELDQQTGKVVYIANRDNLGIATALNKGCQRALEKGYQWILTMDQDSSFNSQAMTTFIAEFESKRLEDPSIAVFTPLTNEEQAPGYSLRVITSGNLLSLDAYKKIGGFDDELFIDEVDHDLCYKVTQNGYKIFSFANVHMEHKLGNTQLHPYLFKRAMWVMHHGAVRKYYIVRNRLIMRDRFPEFTQDYDKFNKQLLIGVIFFEKQKLLKLRYMFKGYRDYRKKRLGKMR